MQKYSLCNFFLLLCGSLFAQSYSFQPQSQIPFRVAGVELSNPLTGGWNAPQFSSIDLDQDGKMDLVVFDRTSAKITCFLSIGSAYQHAPFYESLFPPDIRYWMLLADYDGDGRKDIFTYQNSGARVFRNASSAGVLRFTLAKDLLTTEGFSGLINLAILTTDIPAIVDLDNDNDLDILTFNLSGGYIELHRNLSKERFGHADSLVYKRVNRCWGGLLEGANCGDYSFGIDCGADNEGKTLDVSSSAKILHAGSTLLVLDLNGDGIKDLLIGDVTCPYLYHFLNQGTAQKASFQAYDTLFPPSRPVNLPLFLAAFSEDVDFDGRKDLLVAPNVFFNENNAIDFRASGWYYQNTGTNQQPVFTFQRNNFLQHTTLDLGENAVPALADLDADGDLDLLLGHRGVKTSNGFRATLYRFENIGSASKPAFELKEDDYLGLSNLNLTYLIPQFADADRNGSPDLLITATDAGFQTHIRYIPNTAPSSQAFRLNAADLRLFADLPLQLTDSPYLFDTDRDGDLDLLLGRATGELEFYLNSGQLKLQSANLLPEVAIPLRNPAVTTADLDADGQTELLLADDSGILKIYPLASLTQLENPKTDLLPDTLNRIRRTTLLGGKLSPVAADLNGDRLPDLLIGTQGGGLIWLNNLGNGTALPPLPEAIRLYPNPAQELVYLDLTEVSQVEVFSLSGQQLGRFNLPAGLKQEIRLPRLAKGVYLLRIRSSSHLEVKRLIVY
jgi:hypothetical protein